MKRISPKQHAIIDYALAGSLLILPRLLGLNKKAIQLYAVEALVLLPYIAFTKQPVAIKGIIPLKTHRKIDAFNVAQFALQSFGKPFRKTKRELIFNAVFTSLAGLSVLLTDWKEKKYDTRLWNLNHDDGTGFEM